MQSSRLRRVESAISIRHLKPPQIESEIENMSRQKISKTLSIISLASILVLMSCHSEQVVHSGKLTQDNFAKIHKEMTVAEVEVILGSNDTRKMSGADVNGMNVPAEEYDWKEGDIWISVTFVGGQAVSWESANLP